MILPNAFLALAALSAAAASKVDIFLNIDNDFVLTFNGGSPKVDATAPPPQLYNWQFTNHFTYTVADDEPLILGINATDYGVIAGIAGVVLVDGKVYAATHALDDRLLFSQKVISSDWNSNLLYDDSTWSTIASGAVSTACNDAYKWGDVITRLESAAKVPASVGVGMAWPGGCHNVFTNTFVRLVIPPAKSPPHLLEVFTVVDNNFTLYMPGSTPHEAAKALPNGPYSFDWQVPNYFSQPIARGQKSLLIAMKAMDYGVIAGVAMIVKFNGKIVAYTGDCSSDFRFSGSAPAKGWNTEKYFKPADKWARWGDATMSDAVCSQAHLWGNVLNVLKGKAGAGAKVDLGMLWYPDCHNINTDVYMRLSLDVCEFERQEYRQLQQQKKQAAHRRA
ncbi:hypothetical protein HK101_010496 [Irineochytrium annulatum]|nr:hypothetical protein HK101_010496 [Irineochytrium annulatum]